MTEFWERLFVAIPALEKLIDAGNEPEVKAKAEIEKAFDVIGNLLKESKVNCRIILSVGKRYGAKYPRDPTVIELIFGVHREFSESVGEIENLFKHIPDFKKTPHPKRWFFTKFNPPNMDFIKNGFKYKIEAEPLPDLTEDISDTGGDAGSDTKADAATAAAETYYITQNDIKVGLRVTETERNLVVVVRDEMRDLLLEERIIKAKKYWVPKSHEMQDLIVGCIGEYHMIHTINTMSFATESESKGVEGLVTLDKAQSLFPKVDSCVYCQIPSYSAVLLSCSKCKKVKYCGIKCQVYHFPTHKLECSASR